MTPDGRVNGGLNLSRAIGWVAAQLEGTVSFNVLGDHAYKRVESLSLSEQMISPQPDVKVEHVLVFHPRGYITPIVFQKYFPSIFLI